MSVDVVVNYRSLGLVKGRTRDIGLGGMFVETGRVNLPVNAMLDVSVLIEGAHGMSPFRTGAIVVHSAEGGVGLMFTDVPLKLKETLHEMLYGHWEHSDATGTYHLIH